MFILSKNLWESHRIIKLHCSDVWNTKDSYILMECVLKELKTLLQEAQKTNRNAILICDCNKGTFPPLGTALRLAQFLIGIREILTGSLEYTILYAKNDVAKLWIQRFLSIYKPTRPFYMLENKKAIKTKLQS